MPKLLKFLSNLFSGANDVKSPSEQTVINRPIDNPISPESNLTPTPKEPADFSEPEVKFPEYIGLSSEYKSLILGRIFKVGGNPLTRGYPSDTSNDETDFVARNLIARELLWASRRDENRAIHINIEDESARLLEINLRLSDGSHAHFPTENLRILYSKRKDWQNAARVMDAEFALASNERWWDEQRQADWEKNRARISKNGY